MSLADLLAEDGFKGRRLKTMAKYRASCGSEPIYRYPAPNEYGTSSTNRRTERTRSELPSYDLIEELPPNGRVKGGRPRDDLVRMQKLNILSKKETREKSERRKSQEALDVRGSGITLLDNVPDNETVKTAVSNEIVEVGLQEKYKDICSNEVYGHERSEGVYPNGSEDRGRIKGGSCKDIQVDKRYGNNSNKNILGRSSFHSTSSKNMKNLESHHSKLNKGPQKSNSFDATGKQRLVDIEETNAQPALDEIAVRAVISIFSGYIKRYMKDEDFRTSLRLNCFASLNIVGLEGEFRTQPKVLDNLEHAVETIERAMEESASAKELKKASLQLGVITGLNGNDLRDGFTSGIPNSKLSACAHIYLSVIYKLQKRDRIASKHILQVFCDSPLLARTSLLPELWDYIFLPHLTHLKEWYHKEADSLAVPPNNSRKQELLDKVYNEVLDSATYQLAVYYKEWLTEGVEAPSIPSINIPSMSVGGVQDGGSHNDSQDIGNAVSSASSRPMVSKKLYDAVFGRLHKPGVEVEEHKEEDKYDDNVNDSDDLAVEDKQTVTDTTRTVKHVDQGIGQSSASHEEDGLNATEADLDGANEAELDRATVSSERNLNVEEASFNMRNENLENPTALHPIPHAEVNELTLMRLSKSAFGFQQTEEPVDLSASAPLQQASDVPYLNFLPITAKSAIGESQQKSECQDEGLSTIPKDFLCPMTGHLFEDPVTLETGITFEQAAITEWFKKGNNTCPVTGKTLECHSVPVTNFILKRIIDNWKSEHCRHFVASALEMPGDRGEHIKIQDETSVFIFEQLLSAFSKEEKIENAKHLISLGGLEFLMRRFQRGNLDEKTCVAALLCHCIEVDSGYRNEIAKRIDKPCLLELLHSKQVRSRRTAIILLTELICLKRRKDVNCFLSGLQNGDILNTMHILLMYLQSCPHEQKPLVAVLLLHLDLLTEHKQFSIYREKAVDAITVSLDSSFADEKAREKCCKALLILGARFSSSGKIMTEDWVLKQAGFLDVPEPDSLDNGEYHVLVGEDVPVDGDEEEAMTEWLVDLSISLLTDGKRPFLETITICLGSENLELVRVCLITVAWLSSALATLQDSEFQLSVFSVLISRLKENLETGLRIEHKILASMSLLNFSRTPECRQFLKNNVSKEFLVPLRSIAEVTWTAKELCAIISGEDL